MRGTRTPPSTTAIPASARTASNRAGYLPSRSRMRYFTGHPASSMSITRLRAAWATHVAVGCAVAPRMRMRRGCGCGEDADAAAGVLDDREDVHPRASERDRFEEVRGQ